VQPYGRVAPVELSLVESILDAYFGAVAVVLPPLPLPGGAFAGERGQHDADHLLDDLFARLPERCLRVVGITEVDLFINGRTFVFGYAHLSDGTALVSLARLRESFYRRRDDRDRLRARLERALVHEVGHTFGNPHCDDQRCVMHAVSHVETLDALAPDYCAACASRVAAGLAIAPWSAHGRWARGLAHLRRRSFARAVAVLEQAARSAPRDVRLAGDLARARLQASIAINNK
jgi:archaemetzincin